MNTIVWASVQNALGAAGYAMNVDGIPGKVTFASLFAYVAKRKLDDTLLSLGAQATVCLPKYGIIDTRARLAEFCAETCHETGGYTRFEENMRYSAKRLMAVWPSRFPTLESALPFAWDPSDPDREDIALANYVYGSRMGNQFNGTDDNDGWDHRGGGGLQHTGEAEYRALRERLGYSPEDVRNPDKTLLAACDYWQRGKLNGYCDRGDFKGVRRAINGGFIGLEEVGALRARAEKVLQ